MKKTKMINAWIVSSGNKYTLFYGKEKPEIRKVKVPAPKK